MHKLLLKGLLPQVLAIAMVLASTSVAVAQPESESHLSKILKSGTIKIAVQSQAPPWGIIKAAGTYQGLDIDMARALGEALGVNIDFVSTTDATRIPLLLQEKVDIVIASFTATNGRARKVMFSIPYVVTGTRILTREDGAIKSYDDLAGKSVAATRGSTGQIALQTHFPDVDIEIFRSLADAIQAVRSHKVAGVATNAITVNTLGAEDPGLRAVEGPLIDQSFFGVGLRPGDQRLLNYINNFIRNYTLSGKNAAAHHKWLHSDVSPFVKY